MNKKKIKIKIKAKTYSKIWPIVYYFPLKTGKNVNKLKLK